ncbi:hypothetical protein NUU61_000928 [Penicillium alfredii]|uniref:Uncharacterized protein n=1 Tax=Penicillium alfredii TaxID=1506179 RepID=A0A9W9KQ65_9EURO|nr:uncharacterized protein NUU61_000928 [Penicillium alfredii]KAJ5115169.1 hypothetical protein NUU61_000928 [Penicillium alfredii]
MRVPILASLFAIFIAIAHGADDTPDVPEGYDVFIPEWEVEVHPGGPTEILNGTVEEVYAQLLKLNPNYAIEFGMPLDDLEPENVDPEERDLEERDTDDNMDTAANFRGSKYKCARKVPRRDRASTKAIRNGIRYLRRLKGRPHSAAGPRKCGRAKKPKTLHSYRDIADGAQRVVEKCSKGVRWRARLSIRDIGVWLWRKPHAKVIPAWRGQSTCTVSQPSPIPGSERIKPY